ncbi:MAG: hypothetical protein L0L39_03840 [Atopostipes suicloacalis]|nr:hypothetical protein [Atopostipes suicloacalis]
MVLSNINDLELESLLLPDDLSSEEKKKQDSLIKEYLTRENSADSDLSSTEHQVEIKIDETFVDEKYLTIDKITKEELFDIFREEPVKIDSKIMFPRIQQINKLFWFLRKLANRDIKESDVVIKNQEKLSAKFYIFLEATIFFGFIETVIEEDNTLHIIPTEKYNNFIEREIYGQYLIFLKALASNESISESLIIQLNDPIFDRISKQMIHNVLAVDENIKNEEITNEDIEKITNNLRYWYLGIRNAVLDV